ncbi:glycosyltransferase [Streptomyces rubiginosohelvolus]|uniref:glycosyltransferase n=1 Tax=Streptomyces rubiginosohelvolus TaxID=67362 RepID=UPI0035E37F3C
MKVLFITGPSPPTMFWAPPVAAALRNAGHEVLMATTEESAPIARQLGLPFLTVTDRTIGSLLSVDRDGRPVPPPETREDQIRFHGAWMARLAAACLPGLRDLAAHWRPDVIIGGSQSYAAGLLATHLGVPYVRHTWDSLEIPEGNAHGDVELAPELSALGLEALPPPALILDVTPPSLSRGPIARGTVHARWVGTNLARRMEPWMLARGERPRICVTAGSRVAAGAADESTAFLNSLLGGLSGLDAEIVVAAPDEVAASVRTAVPGLRGVGWMPLEVLLPNCDLLLHHGGGSTAMNAMAAGTPQVVLCEWPLYLGHWKRLEEHGSALVLEPEEDGTFDAGTVVKACHEMFTESSYRERAHELATEIAALPGPDKHVERIESLA